MRHTKTIIKIGGGVLALTAAAAATAGYIAGRKSIGADDVDWEEDDGDAAVAAATRKKALKDMVRAGRDVKDAWERIQKNAKTIAKTTATRAKSVGKKAMEEVADEDDDDEDDEE